MNSTVDIVKIKKGCGNLLSQWWLLLLRRHCKGNKRWVCSVNTGCSDFPGSWVSGRYGVIMQNIDLFKIINCQNGGHIFDVWLPFAFCRILDYNRDY